MFPGHAFRQLGFHEVIRLFYVVGPFLTTELVDFFNQHPFVTSGVWCRTKSRGARYFLELIVVYFERNGQRPVQGSNAKHLTRDGETQVVSPLDVFCNSRKRPAEVSQRFDIHDYTILD
jgi:hypothetical protein